MIYTSSLHFSEQKSKKPALGHLATRLLIFSGLDIVLDMAVEKKQIVLYFFEKYKNYISKLIYPDHPFYIEKSCQVKLQWESRDVKNYCLVRMEKIQQDP